MARRRELIALAPASPVVPGLAQPRAIRPVAPYPAGGPLDIVARLPPGQLGNSLGPVVVENNAAAGGNLGADLVAKAAPDAMTILMGAVATHAISPWPYAKMPYDALHDYTPITGVARVPNARVILATAVDAVRARCRSPSRGRISEPSRPPNWNCSAVAGIGRKAAPVLAFRCSAISSTAVSGVMNPEGATRLGIADVAALVDCAKRNPGKLNYGSGGNGSAGHLAGETFKAHSGVFAVHRPYAGGSAAQLALVSGAWST
jgi:tripartite-type tricarboxylate transporter receptor subunit TctC